MEPAEGPAFGAPAPYTVRGSRLFFLDPNADEFHWVPTVPDAYRSFSWMILDGVARSGDLFGQLAVDLGKSRSEWETLRADFNRIAADFHRCVQRGPHPPEQGTLFETSDS